MSEYKMLERKLMYQGKILSAYQEKLQFPNGQVATRDLIEQVDAVAILAITESDQVIIVKQYRDGAREELLEIPAGLIDEGEEPITSAKRELLEETGCIAENWQEVASFYASPGSVTSRTTLFVATNLKMVSEQSLDEHEFVEISTMPLSKFLSTPFKDAKTLIATRYALEYSLRK